MFSEYNLRFTRQREIILEELRKSDWHPTADEMYRMVKRRLPNISLGTVYRNLDVLSDCGIINKLEIGGGQKRFDGKAEAHYHLVCTRCGRIEDLLATSIPFGDKRLDRKRVQDFKITEQRVELLGLCPRCNNGKRRAVAGSRGRRPSKRGGAR